LFFMDMQPVSNRCEVVVIESTDSFAFAVSYYMSVIKVLTSKKKLFFGFYRQNGVGLSRNEWLQYDAAITNFFAKDKRVCKDIVKNKNEIYLWAAYAPRDVDTLEMIPKFCQYYLHTLFFEPRVDWEAFLTVYPLYMKTDLCNFVEKGIADILFSYDDDGVFSIAFNPERFSHQRMITELEQCKLLL